MKRTESLIKNILIGILCKPIELLISFIIIPLQIKYLGNDLYGIWITIFTTLSWISVFDLGISNGLKNNLIEKIAIKEEELIEKFISTAYILVFFISLILLFILTSSLFFVNWPRLFNTELLSNSELRKILFLNLFLVVLNFVLNLNNQLLDALQKTSYIKIKNIFIQLIMLSLLLIDIEIFKIKKLESISFFYGGASILINIFFTMIIFYNNLSFIPKIKMFDKKCAKKLLNTGLKILVLQITAIILFSTDNLIITNLFGPKEVTLYSIPLKIYMSIIGIYAVITSSLWPAYRKALVEKDIAWINRTLQKLKILNFLMLFISIILFMSLNKIIYIWMGNFYFIPLGLRINLSIFLMLFILSSSYSSLLNALEKFRVSIIVSIVIGAINIPLSYYLASSLDFGITGVIASTNICLSIGVIIGYFQKKIYLNNIGGKNETISKLFNSSI